MFVPAQKLANWTSPLSSTSSQNGMSAKMSATTLVQLLIPSWVEVPGPVSTGADGVDLESAGHADVDDGVLAKQTWQKE